MQKELDFDDAKIAKETHLTLKKQKEAEKKAKHTEFANETVSRIIDLALKISHYNQVTRNKIPIRTIQEWREMFIRDEKISEIANSEILAETDYAEFQTGVGQWSFPEELNVQKNVVLQKIMSEIDKTFFTEEQEVQPDADKWPLRIILFGRPESYYNRLAYELAKKHPVVVLGKVNKIYLFKI